MKQLKPLAMAPVEPRFHGNFKVLTPLLVLAMRKYHREHPTHSWARIGRLYGVSRGTACYHIKRGKAQ